MNFTLRIYNQERTHTLGDFNSVTISGITLVSKPNKHDICFHKSNQKKFGYSIELSKPFLKWAGSHNYPILAFKGEYIDIHVKGFPRYPAFYQNEIDARNVMNGYGHNCMNGGFPLALLYRKIEILI